MADKQKLNVIWNSKRAREERALAAERRLVALQNSGNPEKQEQVDDEDDDEDDEEEVIPETDQQRRQTLLESTDQPDIDKMKLSRMDFSRDFAFPSGRPDTASSSTQPTRKNIIDLSSDNDDTPGFSTCDVQLLSDKGSTATTSATPASPKTNGKGKGRANEPISPSRQSNLGSWLNAQEKSQSGKSRLLSYGDIVQDEINLRKRESLGLVGNGHRLGGDSDVRLDRKFSAGGRLQDRRPAREQDHEWSCNVCTL